MHTLTVDVVVLGDEPDCRSHSGLPRPDVWQNESSPGGLR